MRRRFWVDIPKRDNPFTFNNYIRALLFFHDLAKNTHTLGVKFLTFDFSAALTAVSTLFWILYFPKTLLYLFYNLAHRNYLLASALHISNYYGVFRNFLMPENQSVFHSDLIRQLHLRFYR